MGDELPEGNGRREVVWLVDRGAEVTLQTGSICWY